MSDPIVILTEEPLGADDRVNIETLIAGGDSPVLILVPANTERHLVVDFLENLSLLEISKAFRELTAHSDPAVERAEDVVARRRGGGHGLVRAAVFLEACDRPADATRPHDVGGLAPLPGVGQQGVSLVADR